MRLIVTKVNEDVINGGANSVTVGIFDDRGIKQMEFNVPRYNLVQKFGDVKVQQELKFIPADVVTTLMSLT